MEQTANHDRCSWWSTLYFGKSGLCEIQHLMNGPWSNLAVSDGRTVSSSLLIKRILFPKLSSFLWEVCTILAYAQTICISLTFKFTFLFFFFASLHTKNGFKHEQQIRPYDIIFKYALTVHPQKCLHLLWLISPLHRTVWVCTESSWLTYPSKLYVCLDDYL